MRRTLGDKVKRTQIRVATLGNVRDIAEVHVRAWARAYRDLVPADVIRSHTVEQREAAWRERLNSAEATTWVAQREDELAGWLCAGPSRDRDASPTTAEIWAMYIDPAHWRRGIGRALWTTVQAHLARKDHVDATVWVLGKNRPAVGFYRAVGFSDDPGAVRDRVFGQATLQEIRLRSLLSARC